MQSSGPIEVPSSQAEFLRLYVFAAILVVAAESIGIVSFKLGPGTIALLPMLWALIIGAIIGLCRSKLPGPLSLSVANQFKASAVLQLALMLFGPCC